MPWLRVLYNVYKILIFGNLKFESYKSYFYDLNTST